LSDKWDVQGPLTPLNHQALALVAQDGHQVASRLARQAGVSRQVANGVLKRLEEQGIVRAEGQTRARVHRLVVETLLDGRLELAGLEEDRVWHELLSPALGELASNQRHIWSYAVTEMINNAIDHSGGRQLRLLAEGDALEIRIQIHDDGEGIFVHIQKALGLAQPEESLLELAKGKLTTAPEAHSGQGIFFTSRAMDRFEIASGELCFRHSERAADRLVRLDPPVPGTRVHMALARNSPRLLEKVFDDHTDPEDLTFDRTVVPLHLAQVGGQALVSRSQAKRIALRFERFKRVELDFDGVDEIGQGFADELFRVFAKNHPQTRLVPVNAGPLVDRMIRRAIANAQQAPGDGPAT
jgi:anti-sigma regulatory factor (Ser/Thr protein kinase)/DNA-binding transcriptional ArsR family regulator